VLFRSGKLVQRDILPCRHNLQIVLHGSPPWTNRIHSPTLMTQSGTDLTTPSPRIVSVVGLKKSGKTTVVTGLIAELRSRGHRVSSIKKMEHAALFLDQEGTDTRLHADAGADVVVALLAGETVRFERSGRTGSLADILGLFPRDTAFLVSEGMVDTSASQLIVLCLRSMDDMAETLAVRGLQLGSVVAISGAAAAGTVDKNLPGLGGMPVLNAADAAERGALADLIIKKAYPGA
jgi:molybdopterin-guanine dinucleotide biosynthesis protein B